ncbi:ABC transporter permease protein [Bacillus sp. TS-2]|nr:ABC transporter permease protein [Bacillus sp. TS-2]
MLTIFQYRQLLAFLVRKELRIKYRDTLLGYFWSLLEPIGLMVIYSIVFSFIAKFSVPNYPLYLISGLIPWMFVNHSVSGGTRVLQANASLLKKVFFPRQIFPLTVVTTNAVNLFISLVLISIFSIIMSSLNYSAMIFLPFVLMLQFMLVLSVVLILSAISVYYRDVEFISNLALRGWMYLSPIIYPISIVPDRFQDLYMLNPMATIISLYHHIFHGTVDELQIKWVLYTVGLAIVLLLISWKLFDKLSKRMGEVI